MTMDSVIDLLTNNESRSIFAEKKSVRQSEHYQASAAGISVEIMFQIWSIDYQGEKYIEHEGKGYKVERTYSTGEMTELVCSGVEFDTEIIILKPITQAGPVIDMRMDSSYTEYLTVWAKVDQVNNRLKDAEFWSAKTLNYETTLQFIIGKLNDIEPNMAIKHQGKVFEISSVVPYGNWIIITAREVVPVEN